MRIGRPRAELPDASGVFRRKGSALRGARVDARLDVWRAVGRRAAFGSVAAMGISARWLKSLVGLRKGERQQEQHRKEDEDRGLMKNDATYQFHGQNQHFQDDNSLGAQEELPEVDNGNGSPEGALDVPLSLEPTCGSPHGPLPQTEDELNEIWAATVIQTAFRAFLVHTHVVMWIPYDGWCDIIGSVEDIQAKLLKRQEAAAKRVEAGKRLTRKATANRSLKSTKDHQMLQSRHHLASSIDQLPNRVELQT
nr:unnamed protein product [Digitaria exilis]